MFFTVGIYVKNMYTFSESKQKCLNMIFYEKVRGDTVHSINQGTIFINDNYQ